MEKNTKKFQNMAMLFIAIILFFALVLLSLSSTIKDKNAIIEALNKQINESQEALLTFKEQQLVTSELLSDVTLLQNKTDNLQRDLSKTSELLVEKNLTINELKQKLTNEKRKLARYKSRYNKQLKTTLANEQQKLNAKLKKEKQALLTQEKSIEQQRAELLALKNTPAILSDEEKKAIDEERVEALMKQFDAYQVDLGVVNKCDKAYLYRYNEAKSTLNHIRTYLQKNEMDSSYYHFVIANDTSIAAQNRKLCLDD